MLKRICIKGYKSFKELDLKLEPLMVILGPNTAGKSNFLDALYLISRLVCSKNMKEAFESHRGLPLESFYRCAEGSESLLQRESISCEFEVDVALSDSVIDEVTNLVREKRRGLEGLERERTQIKVDKKVISERFLRYKVSIEALPKTGYLRVSNEELTALKKNTNELKSRTPFLEKRLANENPRLHLRREGQAHPTYFQIGLDHTIISTPLYEPHYPHITAFHKELDGWRTYYLEPKTLMREDVPLADTLTIGPKGENLAAFLNTLRSKKESAFTSFNKTLQQLLPTRSRIDVELTKEGRVGLKMYENEISFSARLISEGTLRLLGLIAAIHPESPALLIGYEEPENGVHPTRIRMVAEILKNASSLYKKQIIVTTHSPIFAECFHSKNLFVCRKEGGSSTIKPFNDDTGPIFLRSRIDKNLSDSMLRGDLGG